MVGLVALESGSKQKLKFQRATCVLGKPRSLIDTKLGSFLVCVFFRGRNYAVML